LGLGTCLVVGKGWGIGGTWLFSIFLIGLSFGGFILGEENFQLGPFYF